MKVCLLLAWLLLGQHNGELVLAAKRRRAALLTVLASARASRAVCECFVVYAKCMCARVRVSDVLLRRRPRIRSLHPQDVSWDNISTRVHVEQLPTPVQRSSFTSHAHKPTLNLSKDENMVS